MSHENVEAMEKAIASMLAEKARPGMTAKKMVHIDMAMAWLIKEQQDASKTILESYEDADLLFQDETDFLGGRIRGHEEKNMWNAFYDRIKEVKNIHRRNPLSDGVPEKRDRKWWVERAYEAVSVENVFSAEEEWGRKLDLHVFYEKYVNMKPLMKWREKAFQMEIVTRLRRQKGAKFDVNDPSVQEKLAAFKQEDYVSWLKSFDSVIDAVPRHFKYKKEPWKAYINGLNEYLESLLRRSQPLEPVDKILEKFTEDFREAWKRRTESAVKGATDSDPIVGRWCTPATWNMDEYSQPTDFLCSSVEMLPQHMKGKAFKKAESRFEELTQAEITQRQEKSQQEDRILSFAEAKLRKLMEILTGQRDATVAACQLKQSMTVQELMDRELEEDEEIDIVGAAGEELEESNDESDDEERAIYNPLKLPIGWDGKPIPFWLYKLHNLGQEYKCEICGNYSYWGKKAFEEHFSQWRHANGMRALGIPNTTHFKEITSIADAVQLYDKLKVEADQRTFAPETEECEDPQGNIMSRRTYEEMRRQGLI